MLTDQHIEEAKHAVGLDYKNPYTRHGKKFSDRIVIILLLQSPIKSGLSLNPAVMQNMIHHLNMV